jgi:hypothetical protein
MPSEPESQASPLPSRPVISDQQEEQRAISQANWIRVGAMVDRNPKERTTSFGLIYFLAAAEVNRVKIGFTDQIDCRRLDSLNAASPFPLTPIAYMRGIIAVEREAHAKLAGSRRHREWFERSPQVEAFIRQFATPWPAEGEPRVSIAVAGALAETLIGDIRVAIFFWNSRDLFRNPIDWSMHLPDTKEWAAMVRQAMGDRCKYVKKTGRKKKGSIQLIDH